MKAKLARLLDRHYRRPAGIIGRYVGHRMARQHQPENLWTVSLLAIQPTDHILEVGFGPGATIEQLTKLTSQGFVAGVDFSPTMVSAARRRNIQAIKRGLVDLRYGEVAHLPFADSTFDKVLGIHTLYFWSNPTSALAELRRVLKVGGTLVVTFLPRECWPGGERAATIAGVYTGQEVAELMHEAGFAQTRIDQGPEAKTFREIAVIATK